MSDDSAGGTRGLEKGHETKEWQVVHKLQSAQLPSSIHEALY